MAYTVPAADKTSVGIFDLSAKKTTATFDFTGWNFAGTIRKENIEWSPSQSAFTVPVKMEKKGVTLYDYFIINLSDNTKIDLNDFLDKKSISNVRWDPKNRNFIFFLDEGVLYRADLSTKGAIAKIADNVTAYDLSGPSVYYSASPNNLLFKNSLDGQSQPTQITNNFPGSAGDKIATIVVYDDTRISLITQSRDNYIFNKGEHDNYFHKLDSGVLETHFSDDGKKLLFWTDNEISVYYLRDELSQPQRSENELQDITRYSQPVRNVQWLNDYEHIIFTVGGTTKIIELDPRDHRNCMDITSMKLDSPFVIYDAYLGKMFFTDQKDSSSALYSIEFPEKVSILNRIGIGG